MSRGATRRGGLDLARIDTADDYDLRLWADRFGVDKERLRNAVQAVGDRADAVERFLNRKSAAARPFSGD